MSSSTRHIATHNYRLLWDEQKPHSCLRRFLMPLSPICSWLTVVQQRPTALYLHGNIPALTASMLRTLLLQTNSNYIPPLDMPTEWNEKAEQLRGAPTRTRAFSKLAFNHSRDPFALAIAFCCR